MPTAENEERGARPTRSQPATIHRLRRALISPLLTFIIRIPTKCSQNVVKAREPRLTRSMFEMSIGGNAGTRELIDLRRYRHPEHPIESRSGSRSRSLEPPVTRHVNEVEMETDMHTLHCTVTRCDSADWVPSSWLFPDVVPNTGSLRPPRLLWYFYLFEELVAVSERPKWRTRTRKDIAPVGCDPTALGSRRPRSAAIGSMEAITCLWRHGSPPLSPHDPPAPSRYGRTHAASP